jgi:hypothetical protein
MVTGELLYGTPFEAFDCIVIVPPGSPPGLLDLQTNADRGWINVEPFDEQVDGGGFESFQRSFPVGTVVQLTAPASEDGGVFLGWWIDGVFQDASGVLEVTVGDRMTVEAEYGPPLPRQRIGFIPSQGGYNSGSGNSHPGSW